MGRGSMFKKNGGILHCHVDDTGGCIYIYIHILLKLASMCSLQIVDSLGSRVSHVFHYIRCIVSHYYSIKKLGSLSKSNTYFCLPVGEPFHLETIWKTTHIIIDSTHSTHHLRCIQTPKQIYRKPWTSGTCSETSKRSGVNVQSMFNLPLIFLYVTPPFSFFGPRFKV